MAGFDYKKDESLNATNNGVSEDEISTREALKRFFNKSSKYCKSNFRNIVLASVAVVALVSILTFSADTAWAQLQLIDQVEALSSETTVKDETLNDLTAHADELKKQLDELQKQNSQIESSESKTKEELDKYKVEEAEIFNELEKLENYINDNYTPKISNNSVVSRGGQGGVITTDPLLEQMYDVYDSVVDYKGKNGYTEDFRIALDAASVEYKMYMNKLPDQRPLRNIRITSGYGYRRDPFNSRSAFHNGYDLGAPSGTTIYAAGAGEVTYASYHNGGYGNLVIISHGNGIQTMYAHCSKLNVKVGDIVGKGDKIAAVGSTGRSTGPHLHFSVLVNGEFVDPTRYVDL